MPYIGNNHIAGDHTNNFKVLDDISSYTATFDGSATSVVDTTNNTIRVVEHRFIQGQRVTYTNGSGGNIGGLTTGTAYFVIFDSASTIKLATSASNAASSTAINLSAVGTGSSHTLNAAFDGVNTKFKLTHGSGTGARLNNATQINVAINNVLQKPNTDSLSYTEGFAIEDNHKIVFKVAPTSEDIFWGSIIANTLTTFDISDHKIDTFTGDGSTTEFNLSHSPANNESLMVTINGVLQHPSNASTARAYTLIANVIQFTAAPGVGDEIQVRHMGFAGATTADVSGFYGRTGNVVLTSNDHITTGDITARNINASGILTASSASFGGNVSIGGTLTYEDVSNIDSVGVITARDGIDCNGDLDVDGHTNLDNVSIVGVTTITGTLLDLNSISANPAIVKLRTNTNACEIEGRKVGGENHLVLSSNNSTDHLVISSTSVDLPNDNQLLRIGANNEFKIAQDGTHNITYMQNVGPLQLQTDDLRLYNFTTQDLYLRAQTNAGVSLYYDFSNHNTAKLATTATGVTIDGTAVAGGLDISGDIDVDGHTNLDNVSVAGVSTFAGNVTITNQAPALVFIDTDNDSDFNIQANGGFLSFNDSTNSSTRLKINSSGVVTISGDLDVDGHTNLDNVSVAGVTTITGSGTNLALNVSSGYARVVGGQPSVVAHKSSSTFIHMGVENNANARAFLAYTNGKNFIIGRRNAYTGDNTGYSAADITVNNENAVTLSYDGSTKFTTTNTGAVVTGIMTATSFSGDGSNLTGIIGVTINGNVDNRLVTATGTTGTLNGESNLTFNGSTVEIGNSGSSYTLTGAGVVKHEIGASSSDNDLVIQNNKTALNVTSNIIFKGSGASGGTVSEKMRIDSSGRLRVASTTESADGAFDDVIVGNHSGNRGISILSGATSQGALGFAKSGTLADGYVAYNHNSTATDSSMVIKSSGIVKFNAGSVERFRITSTGTVGINETSPLARLHVKNGESNANGYAHDTIVVEDSDHAFLTFLTGTSGSSGINFGDAGDPQRGVIQYDQPNDYMRFITAAGERLRIDSNGQLLVGTTSSGTNVRAVFQGYNGGGENFQARVQFQTNQTTNLTDGLHIANLLFTNSSSSVGAQIDVKADGSWGTNDYPGRIEFKTTADGANSPTERLRIKSNGQIVLGNVSNTGGNTNSILHVEGPGMNVESSYDTDDVSGGTPHLTLSGQSTRVRMDFGTMNVSPYAGFIQARYDNHPFGNSGTDDGLEPLFLNPRGGPLGINVHDTTAIANIGGGGPSPYGGVIIRAGRANTATVNNTNTAIKIYPAEARSVILGEQNQGAKFGGIAWHGLDPHNGGWNGYPGHQCWMGMSYHSTPGQEFSNWQVQMNSNSAAGSYATNVAIQANPQGYITHPNQPYASTTLGSASGGQMIPHNTVYANNGGHFNTSDSRFYCPVDGFYLVSIMIMSSNSNTTMDIELRKNGANANNILVPYQAATGGQYNQVSGTTIIECAKNDYLQFRCGSGSVYSGRHSAQCFALLG